MDTQIKSIKTKWDFVILVGTLALVSVRRSWQRCFYTSRINAYVEKQIASTFIHLVFVSSFSLVSICLFASGMKQQHHLFGFSAWLRGIVRYVRMGIDSGISKQQFPLKQSLFMFLTFPSGSRAMFSDCFVFIRPRRTHITYLLRGCEGGVMFHFHANLMEIFNAIDIYYVLYFGFNSAIVLIQEFIVLPNQVFSSKKRFQSFFRNFTTARKRSNTKIIPNQFCKHSQ